MCPAAGLQPPADRISYCRMGHGGYNAALGLGVSAVLSRCLTLAAE